MNLIEVIEITDNTYWSCRPNLQALPSLTYTLGKESFRGSEEP